MSEANLNAAPAPSCEDEFLAELARGDREEICHAMSVNRFMPEVAVTTAYRPGSHI